MATPKLPGMTPGALHSFAFSPMAHINSPASHLLYKNRSSPASSLPFGTSPNSLPAFQLLRDPHSGYPIAPDEGKKREWEQVVRLLSVRRGRISQEGIERLAEAAGMVVWKEETRDGGRQVTLSKDYAVIDIYFAGGEIKKVACTMANTIGPMVDLASRAGKVLLADLTPSASSPAAHINSSLDAFADNLQRLATLDRLSGKSKINIFAALGGLYDSLRKVYELQSNARDEDFATCFGMGKPGMHAGGKIGLSIEYWSERHAIHPPSKRSHRAKDAMDVDEEEDTKADPARKSFRALIVAEELQPDPAVPLPLLRNSSDWIPADAEPLLSPEQIPWLDPDIMPPEDGATPVSFNLRLSPPVFVAIEEENNIFAAAGMMTNVTGIISTMDREVLGIESADFSDIEAERELWTPEGTKKQAWRLKRLRVPYVKEVVDIPFGHPRDLVDIFSILRQYLLFQSLLSSIVNPTTLQKPPTQPPTSPKATSTSTSPPPIDFTFTHFPPLIRIILPPSPELVTVQIEVHRNAKVTVHVETGAYSPEGPKRLTAVEEKVRKVVEGTCDLGIAVEVVRRLVGGE